MFSIRRQMSSSRERLSGMMKLLQEKSHDLELREGNAAVLLDTANELLEWVEQEMEQDMLALRPPAELDKLKSNSASLTVCCSCLCVNRTTTCLYYGIYGMVSYRND